MIDKKLSRKHKTKLIGSLTDSYIKICVAMAKFLQLIIRKFAMFIQTVRNFNKLHLGCENMNTKCMNTRLI